MLRVVFSRAAPRLHALRPLPILTISTAKSRTADWEPSLRFPSSGPSNTQNATNNTNEDTLPWMVTYSSFNPGAFRPLLNSSVAVPLPRPTTLASRLLTVPKAPATVLLDVALEDKPVTTTAVLVPFRPWPYKLPKWLQPQVGTTYALLYGDDTRSTVKEIPRSVGVLQALLYGVPEPGKVWAVEVTDVVEQQETMSEILSRDEDTQTKGLEMSLAMRWARGEGDGVFDGTLWLTRQYRCDKHIHIFNKLGDEESEVVLPRDGSKEGRAHGTK